MYNDFLIYNKIGGELKSWDKKYECLKNMDEKNEGNKTNRILKGTATSPSTPKVDNKESSTPPSTSPSSTPSSMPSSIPSSTPSPDQNYVKKPIGKKPTENTPINQIIKDEKNVGNFAGYCTCPDGEKNAVGVQLRNSDNMKMGCPNLACVGGTSSECNITDNEAYNKIKVICNEADPKNLSLDNFPMNDINEQMELCSVVNNNQYDFEDMYRDKLTELKKNVYRGFQQIKRNNEPKNKDKSKKTTAVVKVITKLYFLK